jgi:rhodanese-related sulfurtransferase
MASSKAQALPTPTLHAAIAAASDIAQQAGKGRIAPELAARDLNIVLYCKTSGRAALAAVQLHAMGYLKVSSIAGGFDAWIAAGKPTAKPALPTFE